MYKLNKDELLELLDIDDPYVIDDTFIDSINHLLNTAYDDGWCDCFDTYEEEINSFIYDWDMSTGSVH